ncbi:leucine-rich repeat protein [Eubacterium oxidoreducens]|uniref:Leucine rich repeat-containing protein n=1 Tax=Eubacterium oxidoreducens TaxID=1732 RepID=A0A1G6B5V0_EUBOX|nr:leucine-rich repeat protein [Eubacterium oxidoreducens]SDB16048.1 Leucine rich repeat-containing protein [Eubacterium oxidoreducens]
MNILKKCAVFGLAMMLMVSGLAITQQVQAATVSTGKFTINNKRYNASSDQSSSGWRWDTQTATLTLNGFTSSYGLVFDNLSQDVTIKVRGTNTITSTSNTAIDFSETDQDVSFVGKKNGTLTVTDNNSEMLLVVKNNLTISDMILNLTSSGSENYVGVVVGGALALKNMGGTWNFDDASIGVGTLGKITKENVKSSKKIAYYTNGEDTLYTFVSGSTTKYTDEDDFMDVVATSITFTQKKPVVGVTYIVSGVKYLVTSDSTVTVSGCSSSLKKLVIPNTVKIGSASMKVTQIQQKAFATNTKLKSVTIKGKYLTKIGKKAFYKCSNLKTVKFTKKTSVKIASKAFKGIYAKAKIQIVKKSYKAVKKKIKSSGIASTVTFSKI